MKFIYKWCFLLWWILLFVILIITFVQQHSTVKENPFDALALNQRFSVVLKSFEKPSQERCSKKKYIVLLKTHRTSSTTLQNILLRLADNRNLSVGLPVHGLSFSYNTGRSFQKRFLFRSTQQINVLCHHMRFNREEIGSIMPKNTKYITILRQPEELFVSYFDYFHFTCPPFSVVPQTTEGLRIWLDEADRHLTKNHLNYLWWFSKNGMFYDLGFDNLDERNQNIANAIQTMKSTYDLVLIKEYFQESLILLKDLLCLRLEDIRYLILNSRFKSQIEPDEMMKMKIRHWNKADAAVYDFFNHTLWKRIDEYGRKKMSEEKEKLQKLNNDLQNECIEKISSSSNVQSDSFRVYNPKGVDMVGYILKEKSRNSKICQKVVQTEKAWLAYLMKKQHGRIYAKSNYKSIKDAKRHLLKASN